MRKLVEYTPLMVFMVRILMAAFLMVGSFLGFPNDPTLGGMFWLFTGIWMLMEVME